MLPPVRLNKDDPILTCTAAPLSRHRLNLIRGCEISRVSFLKRSSNLRDLPLVQLQACVDRLRSEK